jgi:hypothetical protein
MPARPTAQEKAETLAWLRRISGDLATATIKRLEESLPWYADMPPARRSAVGLVAQAGIASFIQWYDDPGSTPWIAADIFAAAPRELLRSVSLTQTLQLIRVTVAVTEERVAGRAEDLRESILLFSREVAFASADVYARAAEARGCGMPGSKRSSSTPSSRARPTKSCRAASRRSAGTATARSRCSSARLRPGGRRSAAPHRPQARCRRAHRRAGFASRPRHRARRDPVGDDPHGELAFTEIAKRLEPGFGAGHLVLGPTVPALVDAGQSARAALAGFAVAGAWRGAPRPVEADDLLLERALAGDSAAKATLVERIYRPLQAHSSDLVTTLWSYLDNGRSLEATARELFVHPNTVRYRLKRVSDVIGWDATGPREALILQTASSSARSAPK